MTCGVHPYLNLYGPPKEVVERLPEERQRLVRKMLDVKPVNIRVLEGVEWEEIEVKREDEGTKGWEGEAWE